jgi:hypothetical protein
MTGPSRSGLKMEGAPASLGGQIEMSLVIVAP